MAIKRLIVHNVRNISELELSLSSGFNVFYGCNGSGKSSIIEAIHLLGSGRSFRTHLFRRVIQHNMPYLSVFAELDNELPIGMQKYRDGQSNLKINHTNAAPLAEVAALLPFQLINTTSHALLDGGPNLRRQFMDWGMFHVEHRFYPLWKRFTRTLKQRNAVLRQGGALSLLAVWDREFVELSNSLDNLRQEFFTDFLPIFTRVITRLLDEAVELSYSRGWQAESELETVLATHLEQDRQRAYTQHGPHRADVKMMLGGGFAKDALSRGQQKLLVCAMRVALGVYLYEKTGKSCLFLLDDLAAELDRHSLKRILGLLDQCQSQVIMTGIDETAYQTVMEKELRMFHVEQGRVSLVSEGV